MYALVANSRVIQLSDIRFEVHPDLTWVDISDSSVDIGWEYDGSSFVEPLGNTPTSEQIKFLVRHDRDKLLEKTDWVVVKHNELGTPIPQEWLDYRQALRDITEQSGFPEEIEWPQEPES